MKEIKIKLANKNNNQDVSKIFEVLNNKYLNFSNIKDVNKHIQEKQCYVAIQNSKVVGAIVLRAEEQSCEIYLIASRQKGAGKAMINYAVQKCINGNIPKLWCWSLSLYNAKGFYEKTGFNEQFLLKKQWYGQDCYFFGREVKKTRRKNVK